MMRWQASGISRPIPRAVPGRAATTGLPPIRVFGSIPALSIRRRMACIAITPSNSPRAGSSPASSRILAMTFRSIPPAKSFLAEVMMIPLTEGSATAASTSRPSSASPASDRMFIDRPGTSQVMVVTPSESVAAVKSGCIPRHPPADGSRRGVRAKTTCQPATRPTRRARQTRSAPGFSDTGSVGTTGSHQPEDG